MNRGKRQEIFERLREHIENPRSNLEYRSNFELLISVLLSAQATDISVNKATARLYPVANTPRQMLALGEDGVREHIKTIGLFNTKAVNTIKTCQMLVDLHGGEVPEDREALEALPGVGRKTANVYDSGRHPHLQSLEPHQTGDGQNRRQRRSKAVKSSA